ncbi:MAG: hypothetical protein HUJ66_02215 [Oscillospiraceae bacterium]|nr:hypothetical protein [Oscillospiraceae bacterium]
MKKKRIISLLLAVLLVAGLFPAAVFAAEAPAEAEPAQSFVPGPKGDEDVAVIVYGKSMSDAIHKADYSFADFAAALKSELQGILANEKLPEVELCLVNDKGEGYPLTEGAVEDAAFLSSFHFTADGILGWMEYVVKWLEDGFGWLISGVDTVGEFYDIYGAVDVPEGDYTLMVRHIDGDGYTLWQPAEGSCRVHVGDDHVNYVGYEQELGEYTFTISIDLWLIDFDLDVFTVGASLPGVFLNSQEPGFSFTSSDVGGHALPGTEFTLVNRDELENMVSAMLSFGEDAFTNAMNLVGTEGFTWNELCLLNKELLYWDNDAQQIAFNEAEAYRLLETYWALAVAAGEAPMKDLLSEDTNLRVPAILQATADENGVVNFTEDCNRTLVWSMEIMLRMANIVLGELENLDLTQQFLNDPEVDAMLKLAFYIMRYAGEKGVEYMDESGGIDPEFINDWIYPILQNDDMFSFAKDAIVFFVGEDNVPEDILAVLDMLPTHALFTKKLPAGRYIMLETAVPDGYLRSPVFYTMDLQWHTEDPDIRNWCYVTVGSMGVIGPYLFEDFYTFLRENSAAAMADELLGYLSEGKTGTVIQNYLNGTTDASAITIAYFAGLIYNSMGGNLVYESEAALAADMVKYLYAYGRTTQNLFGFAAEVAKAARSVVSSEITVAWRFYTLSTSLRTNIALTTQAILQGMADSIDTTGDNPVTGAVKDSLQKTADSIDTTNRIAEESAAFINKVEDAVKSTVGKAVSDAVKAVVKGIYSLLTWKP